MIYANKERIPATTWRASILSIAQYYGGCTIGGNRYYIDPATDDLVREDIWKKEEREAKENKRKARVEAKAKQKKLF